MQGVILAIEKQYRGNQEYWPNGDKARIEENKEPGVSLIVVRQKRV